MKNEEAGVPMGGVGAPSNTQQLGPEYSSQIAPQGGSPGQQLTNQGGPPQQPMPQEYYSGSQYPQGQAQYSQGQTQYSPYQPQYPTQNSYPQGQQIPLQSYPSPQGEYPPQYGGPVPQQANYPGPRDGVSEIHSPTTVPETNNSHHI